MRAHIAAADLGLSDLYDDPSELVPVTIEISGTRLTCENCDAPIEINEHILIIRDAASEMISHLTHYTEPSDGATR